MTSIYVPKRVNACYLSKITYLVLYAVLSKLLLETTDQHQQISKVVGLGRWLPLVRRSENLVEEPLVLNALNPSGGLGAIMWVKPLRCCGRTCTNLRLGLRHEKVT